MRELQARRPHGDTGIRQHGLRGSGADCGARHPPLLLAQQERARADSRRGRSEASNASASELEGGRECRKHARAAARHGLNCHASWKPRHVGRRLRLARISHRAPQQAETLCCSSQVGVGPTSVQTVAFRDDAKVGTPSGKGHVARLATARAVPVLAPLDWDELPVADLRTSPSPRCPTASPRLGPTRAVRRRVHDPRPQLDVRARRDRGQHRLSYPLGHPRARSTVCSDRATATGRGVIAGGSLGAARPWS